MRGFRQHPFRVLGRSLWLGAELGLAAINLLVYALVKPGPSAEATKALWLQTSSRRVLRVLNAEWRAEGSLPGSGLLVCNHLSYLDVLVLSALAPAVFVAKSEVKQWPVFGWFASVAGTLFIRRDRRTDVTRVNVQIEDALRGGALVVLFPEGTSSGGETVLPFRSSLLEPAAGLRHALSAGLIEYQLEDGSVPDEVCYWRNMTFLPHLINLLSKRRIRATVRFAPLRESSPDRKELARQLHAEVLRLKPVVAY